MSRRTAGLTPRQRDVLIGARDGLRNKEIAERLGISWRTVSHTLDNACDTLGVNDRTSAVVTAIKQGLIPME